MLQLHPAAAANTRYVPLVMHKDFNTCFAEPLNSGFNASIIVRGTDGLWLDTAELASGEGCLSFEVKGTNDANITIRCEPQLDASDAPDTMPAHSADGAGLGQACAVPTLPLTVVLGSHRNTKLKLCGGMDCHVLVRSSDFILHAWLASCRLSFARLLPGGSREPLSSTSSMAPRCSSLFQ